MERAIDRFEAVSDDGQELIVVEDQEFKESRSLSGISRIPGPK